MPVHLADAPVAMTIRRTEDFAARNMTEVVGARVDMFGEGNLGYRERFGMVWMRPCGICFCLPPGCFQGFRSGAGMKKSDKTENSVVP